MEDQKLPEKVKWQSQKSQESDRHACVPFTPE